MMILWPGELALRTRAVSPAGPQPGCFIDVRSLASIAFFGRYPNGEVCEASLKAIVSREGEYLRLYPGGISTTVSTRSPATALTKVFAAQWMRQLFSFSAPFAFGVTFTHEVRPVSMRVIIVSPRQF